MRDGPRFLFVHVNKRCNLRCQHCDFWQLNDDDKPNYLSWPRKRDIIREFGELNPRGAVVTCGGESMLDLEDYFAISIECKRLGLKNVSVINGTRIRDDSLADSMIHEGPLEISVSLNSHRAALHDETRGVKGSFGKAVEALRLLLAARRRNPSRSTRIYVMGLIFDQNYRELDRFYDFVLNEIGADKLKLNFLQPSFGHNEAEDAFFARHCRVDLDELMSLIDACDRKRAMAFAPHSQGGTGAALEHGSVECAGSAAEPKGNAIFPAELWSNASAPLDGSSTPSHPRYLLRGDGNRSPRCAPLSLGH